MGGNTGALVLGFMAGSALTAAAAYVFVGSDLERLRKKEKKRLEEEATPGGSLARSAGAPVSRSSALAVSAAGEHIGFLSDIMKQLWGYIKVAGAASIKKTVEPMFKDMMPGPLSGLHFTKIDLGSIPIRMDNVVVHKVDAKNDTLQFDLDLVWDGNCDIQLKAGSFISFGVKSVKLLGRMCILMRPLTTDLSIVSGIQYTFINPPNLELDFTGLAQVADFKVIDKQIRAIIQDILASMMVLPERMLYKMEPACSFLDIYRKPLGVACIKMESGRGFVVEKRALRSDDVPDCYINATLGGKKIRTKTIKDNLSPAWNEEHDFLMCDMDQIISLEAMDEDGGPLDPDDFLGQTTATIGEIVLNGGRMELPLVDEESHKPNGAHVTLGCEVVNFTSDLTSLKETKKAGCFAGVLIILVVGAFDIPLKKEEAATFVQVVYEGKTFVTGAVVAAPGVDALNPTYDLAFHLPLTPNMVKGGKMKDLSFSLMNGAKTNLGTTVVTHDQVAAAPENVLTEKRPIGKGGAKVEFRVALYGVDRKSKIESRAVALLGAAGAEDYVSVEKAGTGPMTTPSKIRVTAVSGQGFEVQKKKRLRPFQKDDVPDLYCLIKVGTTASTWRTKTVKNSVKPMWNESKEYPFVNHGQIIDINVWDENRRGKDDYIGNARVTVGELLLKGGTMEMELLNEGSPADKYVTFKCELTE